MTDLVDKNWAAIFANGDFICIQTCSGLRRTAIDKNGVSIFLAPNPSLFELGVAINEALTASRMLKQEEIGTFFDVSAIEQTYEDWVANVMVKFNYKIRSDLFACLRHCKIERSSGLISMRPTFHEKLEAWSGMGIERSSYVVVSQEISPQELGQNALVALSRCS